MSRTGSQVLLDSLHEEGVEYIFGIPGTLTLPFYDSLIDFPNIYPIVTRHEQGAAFAADGYSRVSGKTGVVFTVPGPGGTNIATALQSSKEDSVPVVAITSALSDAMRNKSAIHDVDMEKALASCVKKVFVPNKVSEIQDYVKAAFVWAKEGRPGPVQIVMKANLFKAEEQKQIVRTIVPSPVPIPVIDESKLDEAVELLLKSVKPIIYAGSGVVAANAEKLLQTLALKLSAPVITSIKGRGALSEEDPISFGLPGFVGCEDMLKESDLCLALGTGFGQFSTSYYKMPMTKNLIQIDISEDRLGRNYPALLGIQGEIDIALEGILKRLENVSTSSDTESFYRIKSSRALYKERLDRFMSNAHNPPFHGLYVMKTIRDVMPPNTVFLSDSSATQSWLMEEAFTVFQPKSIFLSEAYQSMGYALGASMGAKIGAPERPVCGIIGDGSFTMVCGELAAAVSHSLHLIIVIFNDGKYGALRHSQKYVYGERYIATDINNPDFITLAESFGAKGHKISSKEDLASSLSNALDEKNVHIIDCPIEVDVLSTKWEKSVSVFTKEKQ